jgi:HAD superfamily phosphoserine phosphatase-like hydrolase
LRDVLQAEASMVRGSIDEIAALLRREVHIDPTFAGFVALCRARDVLLTIVSSGIEPIIRNRLEEIGVRDVAIVANGIDPGPDGWRIVWRDDVPNGTDKAALVRAAGRAGARTMFVGDGRSDFDAALAADIRFAKHGLPLERYLLERKVAFEPFSTFAELSERLRLL